MREVELKLSAPPSFMVGDADFASAGVEKSNEVGTFDMRSAYYDTSDHRLARHGLSLRHRRGEGDVAQWQLKLPVAGSDATERDELVFNGAPGSIPSPVRDLVTAFVRSARLSPIATLRTRRRAYSLEDADKKEIAVIHDDEISVLIARRVASRFREIEVEGRAAGKKDLEAIADALVTAGAERLEPTPKIVRVLGAAASEAPDAGPSVRLSPSSPAGNALVAALRRGTLRIMTNDPIARLGEDPEGVHQMRVGARRLRSDLRTFGDLIDADIANPLIEDLKWIAGLLGAVRDSDVMLAELSDSAEDLFGDLEPLAAVVRERREAARKSLLDALRSDRYVSLLESLVDVSRNPKLTPNAETPCKQALPPLVDAAWKKLAKAQAGLPKKPSDEDLHNVRIQAKRTRYAAEAVAPAMGARESDAARFAERAEAIQDAIGINQDAAILTSLIEETARAHRTSGRFNLAAGRLLERQNRAAAEARAMFDKQWAKMDGKKVRAWLK
jgi:CHAD domain-containing protein